MNHEIEKPLCTDILTAPDGFRRTQNKLIAAYLIIVTIIVINVYLSGKVISQKKVII